MKFQNNVTTILLFFTFCISTSLAQNLIWEETAPLPFDEQGFKMARIDIGLLCLSINGAGVFKTTDGGINWENIGLLSIQTTDISVVHDITGDIIFVSAQDGIHTSSDGGTNWTQHTNGIEGITITVLGHGNSGSINPHVLAGTVSNGVYHSVDSGENWVPFGTGLENETVIHIHSSGGGVLYATTQGGGVWGYGEFSGVWTQQNNGNNNLDNPAIASDSNGKLYLASDPYILSSPFNNIQWVIDNQFEFANGFAVTPDDQIFASSLGYGVMKKDVSGVWANYSEGLPADNDGYIDVYDIDIGPDGKMWVTIIPLDPAFPAGIYKTINPVTDVEDISSEIPNTYKLEQNYPNPFNPSTKIEYSIPEASFVQLKVYDILGNEVATLVDEEQSAGSYHANFSGNGLASGLYIARITAGNYTSSIKMTLMK